MTQKPTTHRKPYAAPTLQKRHKLAAVARGIDVSVGGVEQPQPR